MDQKSLNLFEGSFEALGLREIVDLICSYVNPFLVRM